MAFDLDSAAAWCLDYYEQKREAAKEERLHELIAAAMGASLGGG